MIRRLFPPLASMNVPNAMTSLAVFAGVSVAALLGSGHPKSAALLYIVTLGLDYADGIAARRLGQQSAIGQQLDSLADAVNFGALPALVGWMVGLRGPVQVMLLAAYIIASVWRLAWYNTVGLEGDASAGERFRGLPTTYAACGVTVLVCVTQVLGVSTASVLTVYFPLAAAAMVSDLRVAKRGPLLPMTIASTTLSVLLYALCS